MRFATIRRGHSLTGARVADDFCPLIISTNRAGKRCAPASHRPPAWKNCTRSSLSRKRTPDASQFPSVPLMVR